MAETLTWLVRDRSGAVAERHPLPADRCETLPPGGLFPAGSVRVRDYCPWTPAHPTGCYLDIDGRDVERSPVEG